MKEQTEKNTTIQVPAGLKDELEALKEEEETYAGVIKRLIDGRTPIESTEETVSISLPRNVYRMALMFLPSNLSDQIRKGVR